MASKDDEMSDGLQVELFHPDSDREPGDTNIQRLGFDIHPIVFPISLVVIITFVAATIALGDQAASVYNNIFNFVNGNFGWFYITSVNLFIITVIYFAASKYGNIRIGGVEAEKEFSDFSWMAMLFSAGMGIGLMFFSVAEPMWHFGSSASDFMVVPPAFDVAGGTAAAATASMATTFFHWGLHPWAIYALVGLGLAFFSFNRGLPLTFRSIFWPLLGERIYGWPGHVIDLVTVFATLFGLSTSLGLGVSQVNTGLSYVLGDTLGLASIPTGTVPQVLLIAGITLIATASVAAGLDDGVRRLSTLNLYLMFGLLGFLIIAGPTVYIFGTFADGFGAYLGNILDMSYFTGTIGGAAALGGYTVKGWMGSWTIFYWGWWIAWSPFVGMFIARISKGRTVREFVMGVLVLPSLFSFMWLSTFGGSALWVELRSAGGIASAVANQGQTVAMFAMLNQFPLGAASGLIATTLVITFFVTSSDSGSLVIDHLTSGGKHDVPKTQRIFWAVTEGTVAATLLVGGGLSALQTASITTGLPFAVILVLMCYTVYLGLDNEYEILSSEQFAERAQDADDVEVVSGVDPQDVGGGADVESSD
ncbi:BCCT family transporter [Haloquadratum walsbyi]|jgi:choline/carnitine/betaine transport|uniref:Choline/carnitine/betaine transport n=1 Tax=Haloquadratum walsbyi J07HQW2 TaxID=1238425 RepID=U1N1T8_9EURY|nr:BCCT family transporter [Haloquadratum walsbyi]ERG96824.1 MAG: choline/carnitine/betaine transport [Haloquadratum walsbyi J07HQW2]